MMKFVIALYLQMMQRIKLSPLWNYLITKHDTGASKTLRRYILLKQGNIHWFGETNNLQYRRWSHCLFYGGNHLQVNYQCGEVSSLVNTMQGDQYFCDSRSQTSNPWEIGWQQKNRTSTSFHAQPLTMH